MKRHRINEQNPIKTKRLILTPMTKKELFALAGQETDAQKKHELRESCDGVTSDPDQALFYTRWRAELRETGEAAATLGFCGAPEDRTIRLVCEVQKEYRGNGYATEAAKALCDWAFEKEGVYFIQAFSPETDGSAARVLQKLKFYRAAYEEREGTLWELERPASAWMAIYLPLGCGAGIALGSAGLFGGMTMGMVIGMCAGLALGLSLDAQDRAARKREHAPKKIDTPKPDSGD